MDSSSASMRAEGVSVTLSIFAACTASAAEYGFDGSPRSNTSAMPCIESMSSRAQACIGIARPSRLSISPGSRPRRATVTWLASSTSCSRYVDRRRVLHQAQREEHFEEAQLVLVDAHRIEGAHVERAHFDVFDAGARSALVGRSPERATRFGRMKL